MLYNPFKINGIECRLCAIRNDYCDIEVIEPVGDQVKALHVRKALRYADLGDVRISRDGVHEAFRMRVTNVHVKDLEAYLRR